MDFFFVSAYSLILSGLGIFLMNKKKKKEIIETV
jgi:hypothetical protein